MTLTTQYVKDGDWFDNDEPRWDWLSKRQPQSQYTLALTDIQPMSILERTLYKLSDQLVGVYEKRTGDWDLTDKLLNDVAYRLYRWASRLGVRRWAKIHRHDTYLWGW